VKIPCGESCRVLFKDNMNLITKIRKWVARKLDPELKKACKPYTMQDLDRAIHGKERRSKVKIKVIHIQCGGQIGWFLSKPRFGELASSKDFMRMDGTSPEHGERLNETCPACLKRIHKFSDMVRVD